MSELQLITTREFDGFTLDCYVERGQQDKDDFWATREQIGALLGYANPTDAIKKIHKRNKSRLDMFSRGDNLSLHEKGRTVTRKVFLYNFKGLLEICRYSNQPNAHRVIDVLWNIADEIRRTGSYNTGISGEELEFKSRELDFKNRELELRRREADIQAARLVKDVLDNPPFPLSDETRTVFGHELFKCLSGKEYLAMLPESTERWYTATEIGDMFGISANLVGRIAKKHNIKAPDGESNKYGRWIFSKSKYSSREVPSFIYSEDAVEWFRDYQDGLLKEA